MKIQVITSQLKKISNIRRKISASGRNIDLEVDGGINNQTAKDAIKFGADVLVSGSYVFGSKNYKEAVDSLRG